MAEIHAMCQEHGNALALNCPDCGAWAIEATRTPAGLALLRQLNKTGASDYEKSLEVHRRVRRRVTRCWGDGWYGIVQTSTDDGPWIGDEEVGEEGDPIHGYKLTRQIAQEENHHG